MIFLCRLEDVPEGSSREFHLERDETKRSVFAVKHQGRLFAYENSCPHLGIPLNLVEHRFLDLNRQYIICSTHGALFQIHDGHCVFGPCQGEHLRTLEVWTEGEEVFIGKDLQKT